jgi:transposase
VWLPATILVSMLEGQGGLGMAATVAIDLHRQRSVVLGRGEDGEEQPWVRLANEPDRLVEAVMAYGEAPDVAIEATYGWYWAVDALQAAGANVHLVAPARVAAFEGRRVKNDVADCRLLVDMLRAGILPEAWIAPPACRDARELVRYRAKLVGLRSNLKAQVHAVLAKNGIQVAHNHLFDTDSGQRLLDHLVRRRLRGAFAERVESLLELIDRLSEQIDQVADTIDKRLGRHPGYTAVRQIPGVGPVVAGVFIAEIWDVSRFPSAAHLASWCGLTPRHRESDTKIRPGRITKQGDALVRWAAVQAAHRTSGYLADWRNQLVERRGVKHIATVALARKIVTLAYYGMRDGHIRCLQHE